MNYLESSYLIKTSNRKSLILLTKMEKNDRDKIQTIKEKKNTKKIKRKRKRDICNNNKKKILMMMEWEVFFRMKPVKMMKKNSNLMMMPKYYQNNWKEEGYSKECIKDQDQELLKNI
jgi:hypothetical protein